MYLMLRCFNFLCCPYSLDILHFLYHVTKLDLFEIALQLLNHFHVNIFKGHFLFSTNLNYCFHIAFDIVNRDDFKDYERKNLP